MAAAPLPERTPAKTPEWHRGDLATLAGKIIARDRPAVPQGLAANRPIGRAAAQSPQALLESLRARDLGRPRKIMPAQPPPNPLGEQIHLRRAAR